MPRWRSDLLRHLQDSGIAEIALVIKHSNMPDPEPKSDFKLLRYARSNALRVLLEIVDRRTNPIEYNPFELVSAAPLLASANVIDVEPVKKKFSDYFPADDIEEIKAHDLDLMLRFGFRILRGDILTAAKLGIWSFHHGDNRVNRGVAPGYWEVAEQHPATGTVLQILDESLDGGRLLYQSWTRTDRYSPFRNKARIFARSHTHVTRVLRRLRLDGALPNSTDECPVKVYDGPLYKDPTPGFMLRNFVARLARYVSDQLRRRARKENSAIFIKLGLKEDSELVFYRFHKLDFADNATLAQPCLIEVDDEIYLFGKKHPAEKGPQTFVAALLSRVDSKCDPKEIMGIDASCTSVFVFREIDRNWLIASNPSQERLELYRSEDFPLRWVFDSVLVDDVTAHRPVVFANNGKLHLLFNRKPLAGEMADELYHYTAAEIGSTWLPNLRNPVIDDVRSAASAGGVFRCEDGLIRPTLDHSMASAGKLGLRRLKFVSEDQFYETLEEDVQPRWVPNATMITGFHRSTSCCVLEVNCAGPC